VATLLPADFDLTLLPHSEQRVCKAFLLGLDATWTVIPCVPIVVDGADSEIDVVLVCASRGVIVVEVKGGVTTQSSDDSLLTRPRPGTSGPATISWE